MKRRLLILLGVLVAVLVAVTGASARSDAPPTKTSGTLVVGFDLPAVGFWNGAATGTTIRNPTGFEASLARAIAKKMGIKTIRYLRAPFGTLFSPAPKPFDFALEETTITKQRSRVVTFSTPYFSATQGVLIRKGIAKPRSIAALRRLQTCAQKDTTGLAWIQHDLRPSKQPLVYSASSTAAFDAVQAGRCDALILDTAIVAQQARKKKGAYGGVVAQIDTHERYGAVMQHGSKLKPSVDRAIKALRKNGTIRRLAHKWLKIPNVPVLH